MSAPTNPGHGADYLIGRLRIVLEDAVTRHRDDAQLADALDAIRAYEAGEAEALAAVQDAFAAHEAQRDSQPATCFRCKAERASICCSSHGTPLCHLCYRRTHFVEVCGCSECVALGLPKNLRDLPQGGTR